MQQNPSGLVGDAEIARHGERRLAFDLVAKHGDGGEIGAQRELVEGEQRPASDGEIRDARLATEAERARGAAAFVGVQATAGRANRLAVGFTVQRSLTSSRPRRPTCGTPGRG